tara:strand:- start:144 stop:326 length:183 start_codon:yes stop_codon:yes gene_type:complete
MKKEKEKGLKKYKQKMYKVGFGPNLNALLSEDSLSRYTYLEGAYEYVGEREITYIEEEDL